jgi:serine/threonine-protein kinase
MDQLVDSLTVGLLNELARNHDIVAVRTASLRARSLPALKAFLEGERLYRRGSWDSAQAAYRTALRHDSTFVPALRHLGKSMWWASGDNSYVSYLLRAGELNRNLPRRDSLLVAADSLYAALEGDTEVPPDVRRSLARRLFRTLENGVRLYPEDPELWYELGEARFHHGWTAQVSPAQMLDAFDQSIALDSSFTPAYGHTPRLGTILHGRKGWDRYARPYLRRRRLDDYSSGTALADAVLTSDPRQPEKIDSMIRATSVEEVFEAIIDTWAFPDSAETAIRLARAFPATRGRAVGFLQDPAYRRQILIGVLGFRGHVREATKLIDNEQRFGWISAWPAEMALTGGAYARRADSTFGQWLRGGPFRFPGDWPLAGSFGPLMFVLPWWSARQDTGALAHFTRRADSAQQVAAQPFDREIAQYFGEAARAYAALARADTGGALRRFRALPDDVWWGSLERVTEAQIHARQGRDRDAVELFESAFPVFWWGPVRVLTALEAGRAAERLGEQRRAAAAYQFVVDAWRQADPELQPHVTEARQALARLTSETRN